MRLRSEHHGERSGPYATATVIVESLLAFSAAFVTFLASRHSLADGFAAFAAVFDCLTVAVVGRTAVDKVSLEVAAGMVALDKVAEGAPQEEAVASEAVNPEALEAAMSMSALDEGAAVTEALVGPSMLPKVKGAV